MMQKRLLFIVAGIVFGFSLLAHLPARMVVPEHLGKLHLLGIRGTVWRGEIQQMLYSGRPLPVRNLHWKVRPAALLRGALQADFHEQQTPANRGNIGLDLLSRQLQVQALRWQFPGSALDPWFRAGAGLQGHFAIDLQAVQLAADTLVPSQLEGQLTWQNAVLNLDSEQLPIGSPVMQLSGDGDAISGIITNSQPLVPGDASFQCTTTICAVDLSLQPAPDAPQSLLNGLLLLGLQQTGKKFSGQISFSLERPPKRNERGSE